MVKTGQSGSDLAAILETARRDLLELGLRNPLLNYRPLRARGVEIVQEDPAQVFQVLVRDEKRMTFLPAGASQSVVLGSELVLEQPEEDESRRSDLRLQTTYTSSQLQARLLATYHAAHTAMEEQGVNTLYLALGMLCWCERDDTQKMYRAPLILIPVELDRSDARDRFHLKYTGEELGENVSVSEKLKVEFGFKSFPQLPETDELDVKQYFEQVQRLIRRESAWSVDTDAIALGFFSFAKFLMYRDLDPGTWAEAKALLDHRVLCSLLGADGFEHGASQYGEDRLLDDQLGGRNLPQVVDADSTQSIAILDVLDGHDMVVQGPPGTGKSQTIVNMISAAAAEGKRILFVSEKMAALDVVKRRLDKAGLGGLCLELHSNRSNKKAVLDELKRTASRSGLPTSQNGVGLERLALARDRLNEYCKAVNEPVGDSGETPRSAYGQLLRLNSDLQGLELPALKLDAAKWSAAEAVVHRGLVEQLQQRVERNGVPARHPFWGSGLLTLLPTDSDDVARCTKAAIQAVDELAPAAAALADACGAPPPSTTDEAKLLIDSGLHVADAPELTGVDPSDSGWLAQEVEIAGALTAGKTNRGLRQKYGSILHADSWEKDVGDLRRDVARVGARWWRFLSPRWRGLREQVQAMCVATAPRDKDGMLGLLDAVLAASRARKAVFEAQPWISLRFGCHWRGADSDWELLERQAAWIVAAHRKVRAGALLPYCIEKRVVSCNHEQLTKLADQAQSAAQRLDAAVASWIAALKLEQGEANLQASKRPWAALRELWASQLANLNRLQGLIAFNQIAAECRKKGLSAVVDIASEWDAAAQQLVNLFERHRLSALLQRAFQERPALAAFDGGDHGKTVDEFRRLDLAQMAYYRASIAARHQAAIPAAGGSGEVGILWREFEKKRKHLPIRKLIEGAGHAIQGIKPVFMMSPLSIANYIPPGCLQFDLVVFDEASQVRPVDALGAVVRGKQIVVVGDSKQLPPTSFFDSLTNADESDDEGEEPLTADIESILGMFSARGAHQRMLKWHYRSRHESLISVSNHLFYEDQLVVFPSPTRERNAIGLVYRQLQNAWYDRGRTRTNPEEAKAVATAVMAHAREQIRHPREQRLTLGVAAFSAAQMDAILNQVELLRRKDGACEEFFGYPPHEPFFIKNLENVQGDERDVIFISIGYARTREGYLAMSFGPLNRPGGERRLNVLVSRARRRCEVFTALTAEDIDTSSTASAGVAALKTFLHYAQTGNMGTAAPTGRPTDSDFEEQVLRELVALRYTVHQQVGCAGFFIDLAVVDPDHPGRYLLGIECDGASYHSARSARDRDRLRQNVLEDLGWRIYRIWSTDWFHNPEPELRKLVQAIQTAQSGLGPEPDARNTGEGPEPMESPTVQPDPPPAENAAPSAVSAEPYQCATVGLQLGNVPLHQVDRGEVAELLARVVAVESPVHWREASRRVMNGAGVQKMGSRIESAFEQAVRSGSARRLFVCRGDFLWRSDMGTVPVRDRSHLPNASRKLEWVAPEEIRRAIMKAVGESCGMDLDEVASAVCKTFGFGRITDEMKADVDSHINPLITAGDLKQIGHKVILSSGS